MLSGAAAIAYLIAESVKLIMAHLALRGSLDTLTMDQAKAMVKTMADGLPDILPTPEELEKLPKS